MHGDAGYAPNLNSPDLNALEAALFGAVRSGNCAEVTALLRQGARTDATDSDLCTPLHAAAQKGRAGVVPLLLRAGADVNAVAADDWTALHLAAFLGRLAVVPQLLLAGANQVRVSSLPGMFLLPPAGGLASAC
jgi:ankyrin repeat protein